MTETIGLYNAKEINGRKCPIKGIIVTRKCDCCGHHEIGIKDESGEYIQLKEGMRITIHEKTI